MIVRKVSRRDALATVLGGLVWAGQARSTQAQEGKSPILKITVGGAPGSIPDVVARLLGSRLGEVTGRASVVENKAGAGGVAAIQAMLQGPRDGNTVALATVGQAVYNSYLFKNLPYDPARDLVPVTKITASTMVVAANPSLPQQSMAEIIAASPETQERIAIGTPPAGTPPHLAALLLTQTMGLRIKVVPYKTGPEALMGAVRGEVQLLIDGPTVIRSQVGLGALRAVAVTSPARLSDFPEAASVVELGYPDARVETWLGVFAPSGSPPAAVEQLDRNIRRLFADDILKGKLADLGFVPSLASGDAFKREIAFDRERWGKLITATGLTLG